MNAKSIQIENLFQNTSLIIYANLKNRKKLNEFWHFRDALIAFNSTE